MVPSTRLLPPDAPARSRRAAANGVQVVSEGRVDRYDLPPAVEGVPRRITVEHRHWWQGGDKVVATDAHDRRMKLRTWGTSVYVTDAKSGVTTQLCRDTLDLSIKAKEEMTQRPIVSGSHAIQTCPLEEHLAANGDIRILSGHRIEEKRVVYGMVRDVGASNCSTVIMHDEDYVETRISHGGEEPSTHRWHEEKDRPRADRGEIASRIDQGGSLILGDGEGERSFELFIAPHAIAQALET
jgi:hypothetical protein